jgi:glycosyltransferase involved in cell wall biosynthesis
VIQPRPIRGNASCPERPRMLIVTTVPLTIRAFLLPFADHYRSRGWTVDAATGSDALGTHWHRAFAHVWPVCWSRTAFAPDKLFRAALQIRSIAKAGRYDVVHLHTPIAAFVARLALRGVGAAKPTVVYTAHGFHFHPAGGALSNAAFLTLERLAGRWTDALVVMNRADELAVRQHRIVPDEKLHVIPGIGVDRRRFSRELLAEHEVQAIRHQLGLDEDSPYVLMVAEFNKGKRHEDALRAFAMLGERRAHLVLVGVGPMRAKMRMLADRLGIGERVHFPGFIEDVAPWISGAHATLLPSEREGLPRSVLESQSMGTPVIGADVRGTRDLLAEGGGLIHPLGDIRGLSRAMSEVLTRSSPALPEETLTTRLARYEIGAVLRHYDTLFDELLRSRSTRAPA